MLFFECNFSDLIFSVWCFERGVLAVVFWVCLFGVVFWVWCFDCAVLGVVCWVGCFLRCVLDGVF